MINPRDYLSNLSSLGINFYAGVPDSLLKEFCACITENIDSKQHIISANEGAAVGLAIGHYLGSGRVPFIYLQNSGMGNIINPILSLASPEVYGVPILIMVGWRGAPGVKDEPQHIHQGRVMEPSLKGMDLPYIILSKDHDKAINQTREAFSIAHEKSTPIFLLVEKDSFERFALQKQEYSLPLSREDAIIATANILPSRSAIVCTTGMSSRELFEFRSKNVQGHHRDFLTVGGMGHASQIALGLNKAQPQRYVYCFDGDGAALMHMGSLAIIGQSEAHNLTHIIFNNGVHDSVGGQATVGFDINFCSIALACGYSSAVKVSSLVELENAIEKTKTSKGPHLVDVHVRPGNRSDIGRPTSTPKENKVAIMNYLNS